MPPRRHGILRSIRSLPVRQSRLESWAPRYYRITVPTITFKVTPQEAARIRRMARREGLTVSEFLRRRAVEALPVAGEGGEYRIEPSKVTGLPVMHAPGGSTPVSSEQVHALLADFP